MICPQCGKVINDLVTTGSGYSENNKAEYWHCDKCEHYFQVWFIPEEAFKKYIHKEEEK